MKILIAPDKFKGSLNARDVAESIAKGLRDILDDARIEILPMADGGEGTVEIICDALGGSWVNCQAHDPLGREIDARYAWIGNRKLAVMEMSEAAGMRRLSKSELDPLRANTFGVGEMIVDATHRGADEIIIGLGGSATNDGGFGMARALGFRFYAPGNDGLGSRRSPNMTAGKPSFLEQEQVRVVDLLELKHIEKPKHLKLAEIIAAVDVQNPLLGKNGATRVFGPQKRVTADKIEILELSLAKLADVISKEFGVDYRDEPGAGAAGGLGFGLMSFCGAKIRPGFEVVKEAADLESKMKNTDLVITGEGSLDRQTLEGKTPAGIARLARKLGKRVFAVVGRAIKDRSVGELFDKVYELAQPGMNEDEQMKCAAELLRGKARELAKAL
jgi:glycerate kinase